MSIAWKAPDLNPGQKLVLIALCDNASDEGLCFPSVKTLARKCSMSERTVQGHLADFEARSFVTRDERPGRSTIYTIHPRSFCAPPECTLPAVFAPPPAVSAPTAIYEEPSLNHQNPPKPSLTKKGTRRKKELTPLKTWLETIKAAGEDAIPETDPIFEYAAKVGIPIDFMALAWAEFKHRYSKPDARQYKDWRATFRDAIRGNYLKLWWMDPQTGAALTTAGMQAKLFHAKETAAPQEAEST